MQYGDWNAEELKGVEVSGLDTRKVLDVALNEASRLGTVNTVDCKALVETYAGDYVRDDEILEAIAREAFDQFAANPPVTQAGVTPEFIVGHACAAAAAAHVKADLDLVWDDFRGRATEALPLDLADIKGLVTADRMDGGRMEREYRSEQHCTPRDIFKIVADKCGAVAAERIGVDDYEHEAERLMSNFHDVPLEYSDHEQVICDLEETYGDLGQLGQGEAERNMADKPEHDDMGIG